VKISASLYSSKPEDRKGLIKLLDEHGIDLFHIDSNDDLSVFEDIRAIKKLSKTPIDLHIISSNPEKFYPLIQEYKIDHVTFQYENLNGDLIVPDEIYSKLGIAICTDTPVHVFERFKSRFDFILFMATVPGQSGGRFNAKTFKKIRQFQKQYQDKRIHVDGGVDAELSFILRNMGVYVAVVGSYLFKSDSIGVPIIRLRNESTESHYLMKDFMRTEDLPVLTIKGHTFHDVLLSIEKHNLGFVVMVDEEERMAGMITNADVRRGLIKHFHRIQDLTIQDIINPHPVYIGQEKTVTELLKLIRSLNFPLLYLPVTNNERKLSGVITFNNLIKGES
jgi:ribulose-phosphate 3-epimerase